MDRTLALCPSMGFKKAKKGLTMETATLIITINMSKADYDRLKAENSGKLRTELEKVIVEKMGGEYVVKSLKAEFGEIK